MYGETGKRRETRKTNEPRLSTIYKDQPIRLHHERWFGLSFLGIDQRLSSLRISVHSLRPNQVDWSSCNLHILSVATVQWNWSETSLRSNQVYCSSCNLHILINGATVQWTHQQIGGAIHLSLSLGSDQRQQPFNIERCNGAMDPLNTNRWRHAP